MSSSPSDSTLYCRPGLSVEIYDAHHAGDPMAVGGDAAFLLEQARATGGPVLELACGTGRVLWPIARAGCEAVGLDASAAMLAVAESKRASHPDEVGHRVTLFHGDMTSFDFQTSFDLVFCTFRSFQALLTPQAQRSCLRRCFRHLKPGGRLVLDLFDPRLDLCLPDFPRGTAGARTIRHPGSGHMVSIERLERTNDPVTQVLRETWRYTESDERGNVLRREEERIVLRWTYRYEMRHLLELCGFEVLAEYSDFQCSPPAYGKEQVWVAVKGAQK